MPLWNYLIFLKQEAEDILKNIEMANHRIRIRVKSFEIWANETLKKGILVTLQKCVEKKPKALWRKLHHGVFWMWMHSNMMQKALWVTLRNLCELCFFVAWVWGQNLRLVFKRLNSKLMLKASAQCFSWGFALEIILRCIWPLSGDSIQRSWAVKKT